MKQFFMVCLLAVSCVYAQAGVAVTEIPAQKGDGPVTVFYPTNAPEQARKFGPFTLNLAAPGAPVTKGNGRLIVISHGSGGNPWVHSDLARDMVNDGFIVAMPEHRGDNARDPGKPGPESWKIRPLEVSRAIDSVAQDARFAPLLLLDKVGMYGMSAGGHTALSLAGGRFSSALFRDHCEANIADDFATCVGLTTRLNGDMFDGAKKSIALGVIRNRFDDATWSVHTDPRIRAIVAGVPAAADFEVASLASPTVPLGFVTAAKDKWLVPKFHSDRILAACKKCEVVAAMPTGGHGALLSPQPPLQFLGDIAKDLLGDPPGFERATVPEVDRKITAFFHRHLL